MLWHIEMKFCIWLSFTLLQVNLECCQFVSIFVGVMPLLELRVLEIHSFPLFFSHMLWHIELKFCIWLCFTVLQIECHQFVSMFVGFMPFQLIILKIHNIPLFYYMLWHMKFFIWLCFRVLQIKFECHQFAWIFYTPVFKGDVLWYGDVRPSGFPSVRISVRPFSALFSYMLWHILSLNFAHDFVLMYYRLSLSVVTFRQFLKELCPFVNLEYR